MQGAHRYSAAARDGELLLYALLTVMNRMTAPWQLIRLGVKAAGSDTAARVAETNYGEAVNIVLAELERIVAELRNDLRSGQALQLDRCSRPFTIQRAVCALNWRCLSIVRGVARLRLKERKFPICFGPK